MNTVTLLLPGDTGMGVPNDPETHAPRWKRTEAGIEATYTVEELGWALGLEEKVEAGRRLLCR